MGLLKYNIVLLVLCLCFVFGNGRFLEHEQFEGSGSGDYRDNDDDDDNSKTEINTIYHDLDEPSCFPPCQNNGTCIEPGVCQCPEKVEGKQCQFNYNSKCKRLAYYGQVVIYGEYDSNHYSPWCSAYNRNFGFSCYILCKFGYQIPGYPYSPKKELTCVNEEWYMKLDGNLILPYCEAEVQPEVGEEEDIERESDYTTISTTFSTQEEDEDHTEEDEVVTEPDCSQPCQNNGTCVAPGVCQCPEKVKGKQCQFNYNSKCELLDSTKFFDADYEPSKHYKDYCYEDEDEGPICHILCEEGYKITGAAYSETEPLTCVNGEWYMELDGNLILPNCEAIPISTDREEDEENEVVTEYVSISPPPATCSPPCQNDGTCVEPGICQCPENIEGPYCEYNSLCTNLEQGQNFDHFCSNDEGQHSCSITCYRGYRIPGTQESISKDLNCVKGEWYIESDDGTLINPSCEAIPTTEIEEDREDKDEEKETTTEYYPSSPSPPTCSPPCQNNGTCVAPDICQCPENIEGLHCEFNLECKQLESSYDFLTHCYRDGNGQHSCRILCYPGYRIPGTQQSYVKDLSCVKGEWYLELDDGNLIDPFCEVDLSYSTTERKNWISSQTEEVTENHSRSSYDCQEEPPMSKNAKLIRLISDSYSPQKYIVECLQGYIFPDNTKEQYLECVDGMWYHKQTGNSKAPDCGVLCPGEQIFAEAEDCIITTCADLANNNTCQNNIKAHCRCPYGEYLNDKDECVAAKDCPCFYDGFSFAPSYKHNRAGEKFLELCTCEDANWNCSSALEGDLQKYPSASDLNFRCEQNPDSCKIKTSIECSEKSTDNINNNYGFINNLINKLTHSVDLNYQNKLKEITTDCESMPSPWQNADEPDIKVMSLNLQSMEIRGGSRKYKEKTIHGLN